MTPTPIDRAAFKRAIALARRDPAVARQLDDKLKDEPRDEVGAFASYHMQFETLRLKPWDAPPCELARKSIPALLAGPENHRHERRAAALAQRLLDAGLSLFEPDPIAALAAAERTKPAA